MLRVVAPKTSRKLPVFIDPASIHYLFHQLAFDEGFEGQRDHILLELLYATGMRRAELINLKPEDIDFDNKLLRVTGKGNKERLIPMDDNLCDSLQSYLSGRRDFLQGSSCSYLLIDDKGRKADPRWIYSKVNFYLKQVSTLSKTSPHVLRHSFATHLSNNGASLAAIKELLGHASLASTQVYTHNTLDRLREVHARSLKRNHKKS
jgi:integrase/recombinase XerC